MSRAPRSGSQHDAERVRRLLTRLAESGASLCGVAGGCAVVSPAAAPASPQDASVPASLVSLCLAQDWLERNGRHLVLSDAGRAWLRRSEAAGDEFRQQHQLRSAELKEIEGVRRPVVVNEAESPLGWLKSRKDRNGLPLIADHQYQAGERLRADYWFARLSPRVTANWSALAPSDRSRRAAPSDPAAMRDNVIAAKERVTRALVAVGPELAGVLIDICCELKGLEEAEKGRGWPQRAGKVVLQIALTRLARHYGLDIPGEGRKRGGARVRHWGGEDYRPTLDAWGGSDDQ